MTLAGSCPFLYNAPRRKTPHDATHQHLLWSWASRGDPASGYEVEPGGIGLAALKALGTVRPL